MIETYVFTGMCAQCRIDDKLLPVCRDEYFICAECEEEIGLSLTQSEPAECAGCHHKFSWLWGRFETDGTFSCRNCIPGGWCFLCHQNQAACRMQTDEGKFFACSSCANQENENRAVL